MKTGRRGPACPLDRTEQNRCQNFRKEEANGFQVCNAIYRTVSDQLSHSRLWWLVGVADRMQRDVHDMLKGDEVLDAVDNFHETAVKIHSARSELAPKFLVLWQATATYN